MSATTAGAPRVSVVITTRNRPELLREAIAAIAGQTYQGVIETIVVFDQSEVDEGVVSDDPRRPVSVHPNDRSPGLPGGRNTGARLATGEFLCFCDDDDVWVPAKVSCQLDLFDRRPWLNTVFSGITVDFRGEEQIDRIPPADELTFAMLLRGRVMEAHISSAMCRTSAFFAEIGDVDEKIPGGYYEDYDWTMRAARDRPIGIVRAPLVRVRWTGGSFFQDRFKVIDEATQYMLDKYPEFVADPVGHARLTGQQAFYRAASGDRRGSLDALWRTARTNWRELRTPFTLLVLAGIDANTVIGLLNKRGRSI